MTPHPHSISRRCLLGMGMLFIGNLPVHAQKVGGPELEVMTFNIRYPNLEDGLNYWPLRKGFVADVMLEHKPDVIGVQEAMRGQLDDLAKRLEGYTEVGVGRDDGKQAGEYSAILYKKSSLELKESGTYWLSDTPEVPGSRTWNHVCPRVCTWAYFRHLGSETYFYMFNTHWDNASAEARTKSATLMQERIKARKHTSAPFFITGDFNCAEGSEPINALSKGLNLLDSFRVVNPNAKDTGTIHFWSGKQTNAKIDYILVEPSTKVLESEINHVSKNGRFPSDHFPVRAKINLMK